MTRRTDCRETNELLPWYINQTLDEEEGARVREHLQTCEDCRAELPFLAAVYEATREDQIAVDAVTYGLAGLRFLESLLPTSGRLARSVLGVSWTLESTELVMDWMPTMARDLIQSVVA